MSKNVKIGQHYNTEIYFDFNKVDNKTESALEEFDFTIGRVLRIASYVIGLITAGIIVIGFRLNILLAYRNNPLVSLLTGVGILIFIYSMYLLRDKSYLTKGNNFNSLDLKRETKVQFDKYFEYRVIRILRNAVDKKESFLGSLFTEMVNETQIASIFEQRLGVKWDIFIQRSELYFSSVDITFRGNVLNLLNNMFNNTVHFKEERVDEDILIYTFTKLYLSRVLADFGVTDTDLEGLKLYQQNEIKKRKYIETWKILSQLKPKGDINRSFTSRATPNLDIYGEDLTKKYSKGNIELSIGREDEMLNLMRVLQKPENSNALLIGEPGTGKTRFLNYLATRMVVEDVPKTLQDYRLIKLDLNKVFNMARGADEFKILIQKLFKEVKASGNIILILEEITSILNVREEAKVEITNTLIGLIKNTQIKLIATTNRNNYNKFVKPNKSLDSQFEVVNFPEPSRIATVQILLDEAGDLEKKYGVTVQVNVIKRIVEFSPRIDSERSLPDKAIGLLQEGLILAQTKGMRSLNETTIDELLSSKTGVKVGSISESEVDRLKKLEEEMHQRVVGQEAAIKSIAMAVRRSRSGLNAENRPTASFLFFGPTGVGKTESAKALADVYFGNENLLIRVDMSEYQEERNLERLIGYMDEKGNYQGGFLTERVRARPFSLVLLDEIDKANKKVLDLFLQVLDEGFLTDGMGRRTDFRNTIIIMTTNAGSSEIAKSAQAGEEYKVTYEKAYSALRDSFRIEFLNRFDKTIMFKSLSLIEIEKIVEIMLDEFRERLLNKGISMIWDEKTLSELAKLGYNPVFGARELRRVIQESIEDQVAQAITEGRVTTGADISFTGLNLVTE
jgi:ATP-dependent Clp protease ATP-binding subunit ClpC